MPTQMDFPLPRGIDAAITFQVEPPVATSGWNLQFLMTKRFGGNSGLITKSIASGFPSGSGITLINGGQGIFNIAIAAGDTSGLDYGTYTHTISRLNSGNVTCLAEGFVNLLPGVQ